MMISFLAGLFVGAGAVKTNFAACHGRTDYPRPRILSMHAENAMMAPRRRNLSTLIYNVFRVYGMTSEYRGFED